MIKDKFFEAMGLPLPTAVAAAVKLATPKAFNRKRVRNNADLAAIDLLVNTPCKDGERTPHLTRLIGVLLANAYEEHEIMALLEKWNAQNIDTLPAEKLRATYEGVLATDRGNHPERYLQQLQVPELDLEDACITRFLNNDPPPRLWLLNDTLVVGKVGSIVAPGGSSKSQLLLQLAVSVATGLPLADHWEVGEKGKVLIISAEDDDDEIHRRIKRIQERLVQRQAIAELMTLDDNLFILCRVGMDNMLTRKPNNSADVENSEFLEAVIKLASEISDLRLIVLDPASRFRGGDENRNEDATAFISALESIVKATGASLIFAHHTNKGATYNGGTGGQNDSRGASALTDGVRWQMNLSRKEAKGGGGVALIEAKVTKTNYSAYPEPVLLERQSDGYLAVFKVPGAASGNSAVLVKVLQIVGTAEVSGKPMSARQIEAKFGGLSKELKVSAHELREIIKEAISANLISGGDGKPLTMMPLGNVALADLVKREGGAVSPERNEAPSRKKSMKSTT